MRSHVLAMVSTCHRVYSLLQLQTAVYGAFFQSPTLAQIHCIYLDVFLVEPLHHMTRSSQKFMTAHSLELFLAKSNKDLWDLRNFSVKVH